MTYWKYQVKGVLRLAPVRESSIGMVFYVQDVVVFSVLDSSKLYGKRTAPMSKLTLNLKHKVDPCQV